MAQIKNNVISGKKWEAPRSVAEEFAGEMYAVGKKLAHHEINTSGDLVVSKSGLANAIGELANLSDDEKTIAKAHLRRHYDEHKLTVPGSLTDGEMQKAERFPLDGEMVSGDEADRLMSAIPVRPGLDIEKLKEGDDNPVDYIVRVQFRTNTKGWIYDDSAYDAIVSAIHNAKMPIPSYKGHQAQEAAGYEFRDHGGTVVGALKQGDFVYYRIVVDKGEDKLKWLIQKGLIGEVSIWGRPSIVVRNGETHVVDYELWSVDFTPPNRTGQDNEIVSVGEIDDGSHEALRDELSRAVNDKYPDAKYAWVERTFDNRVIVCAEERYYQIPYTQDESGITLGNAVEVDRVVTYVRKEEEKVELNTVPNDALLAELKARTSDGRIAPLKVAGEMGIPVEDPKEKENAGKYAAVLAAAGEMDPIAAITYGKEAKARDEKAAKEKAFGEMKAAVIADKKIEGELAKWVDKLGKFNADMTREQVAGEIDRVQNDPDVKAAIEGKFVQRPKVPTGASGEIATAEV
jgi:hypothetical protein